MRFFKLIFFLIVVLVCNNLFAQKANNSFVESQVIVMFNNNSIPFSANDKAQFDTQFKEYFDKKVSQELLSFEMNCWLYHLDKNLITEGKFIELAKDFRTVKYVQLNHYVQDRSIPNDSLFNLQWDLHNTGQEGGLVGADISALEAWDITTGGLTSTGDSIVVAVIDGGFNLQHQDLNYWKNYADNPNDTLDNDSNGYKDDYNGWNSFANNGTFNSAPHGTHICGTIGAKGNNNIGVTGINWDIKVMPISRGSSTVESVVVSAYGYVLAQRKLYNKTNGAKGAFVVATNSSFGVGIFGANPNEFPIWCAFYDSLGAQGILSAAATSNSNVNIDDVLDVPTACASNFLISVTNTTNDDTKYFSAGYGINTIDIGAPGVRTYSTIPNNNYAISTGTSMATPHVAGAIALMISAASQNFIEEYKQHPANVALFIKDQLLEGVDTLSSLSEYCKSKGRLNLFKSVSLIKNFPDSLLDVKEVSSKIYSEAIINKISPNPISNFAEVEYFQNTNSDINIHFFDIAGNLVYKIDKGFMGKGIHRQQLNLSLLANGIYFAKIESNKVFSAAYKICINKN